MDTALKVIITILAIGVTGALVYLLYRLKFFDALGKFLAALFVLHVTTSIVSELTKDKDKTSSKTKGSKTMGSSQTGSTVSSNTGHLVASGISAFSSGDEGEIKRFAHNAARTLVSNSNNENVRQVGTFLLNNVSRSEERTGFFGDKYTQHHDKDGSKAGRSEERTGFFGDKYTQHHDKDGSKAGRSEERTGFFGDKYTQHHDKDGNKAGRSEERTGFFGDKYTQHYDKDGNKK